MGISIFSLTPWKKWWIYGDIKTKVRVYEQHEQHVKISFYDGVTGYVLNQPTMIWVYLKMVEFGVQN